MASTYRRDKRGRFARQQALAPLVPAPTRVPAVAQSPDYSGMWQRARVTLPTPVGFEREGLWLTESADPEYDTERGAYRTGQWMLGEGLPPSRSERQDTRAFLDEWMEPEGHAPGGDIYHDYSVRVWRELNVLDAMEDGLDRDAAEVLAALGGSPEERVSARRRAMCEEAEAQADAWAGLSTDVDNGGAL